jgi:hypothetical protein
MITHFITRETAKDVARMFAKPDIYRGRIFWRLPKWARTLVRTSKKNVVA